MAQEKIAASAPAPAAAGPSDEEVGALLDGLDCSSETRLIGLLQAVQGRFGYLPPTALEGISRRMRLPLARIYGVVSFYAQFYTEPRGKHTVRACRGTACHVRGGKKVIDAVSRTLGIADGETTEDMMFSFETVACLGACALSPVIVVDGTYYGKATPRRVEEVLARILAGESDEGDGG